MAPAKVVKQRLRVWIMPVHLGPRTGIVFKQLIQPYLDNKPHLSVELRLIPWGEAFSVINHAFKTGDPPDLFQLGTTWIGAMGNLGYLAEIPSGLEKRPTLAPWVDEIVTMDCHRYAIPWATECSYLMARKDILDEVGVSPQDLKNWQGFLDTCKKVAVKTDPNLSDPRRPLPLALTLRPDYNTLHSVTSILWSGGWKHPDLSLHPLRLLSDPSAEAGWQYLSQLIQTNNAVDYAQLVEPHLIETNFYQNGRFAFYLGYGWHMIRQCLNASDKNPWPIEMLAIPRGPAGKSGRGGGAVLAVSSRTAMPHEAFELAQFLISDDFTKDWVQYSGMTPAHEGEFWQQYADRPQLSFIREETQRAVSYPTHPLWYSIEQSLFKSISDILWRYVQGQPYDTETRRIAKTADDYVNAMINMAWDLHQNH